MLRVPRRRTTSSYRRSIFLLVGAQGIYLLAVSIVFSFSSLVSKAAFSHDGFATLPLTILTISAALATLPVSTIMQKYGQRAGFVTGALCGAAGAAISTLTVLFLYAGVSTPEFKIVRAASLASLPRGGQS